MKLDSVFFLNSILLGIGLAIDAFSVSVVNALNEPNMSSRKKTGIAGVFAFFQAAMPLTGWILVHTVIKHFKAFEKYIPWIALLLLCFIGVKMLVEGFGGDRSAVGSSPVTPGILFVQGIATSIDALSVGFTIAEYSLFPAVFCSLIIAAVTFVISSAGIIIGKKFGTKFTGKASVFGGFILIGIGIEIFAGSFLK